MLKKILYFFTFLTIFLFATPINNPNIYPRIALVIGNSDYPEWGDLDGNPIKDATDMKKLLESRGFDVLYKTNAKQKEFEKLLIEFRNRLRQNQNSIGLFYFSGHGMEIEGTNYLIPVDSQGPARYDNIELNKIINDMGSSNNQLNIIILDACRDNPFILTRSFNKGGFAKIVAPEGLFISYATKAGKFAQNGKRGENGLFTKYLLYYMQQPLKLYEVFKETRKAVFNASAKEQLPTVYDQTIGDDFYFTMPKKKLKIVFEPNKFPENSNKTEENSILKTIIDFFISNNKSPLLNTFFILIALLGFGMILFTIFTSFLYSERINYTLKALAITLFFFGISGYIMSNFLHLSDKSSFLISLIIGVLIFIIVVFLTPKQKEPKTPPKPISLVGNQAILLNDIKVGQTGHANIITNSSRYRKLVRNKSMEDLLKGDKAIVMSDEFIPSIIKE